MKKITENIYTVSCGGVAIFSKDKNIPTHSQPKILPSNEDTDDWCSWGEDTLSAISIIIVSLVFDIFCMLNLFCIEFKER